MYRNSVLVPKHVIGIPHAKTPQTQKVKKSNTFHMTNTSGSMNSLFSNLFREFWRGISGGVRDYLGVDLGRLLEEMTREITRKQRGKRYRKQSGKKHKKTYKILLDSLFNDRGV